MRLTSVEFSSPSQPRTASTSEALQESTLTLCRLIQTVKTSKNVLLLSFLIFSISFCPSLAGNVEKKTQQFRMDKVNFVWSKAEHHLQSEEVAQRLQKELKKFDGLYASLKQDADHLKSAKSIDEVDDKLEKLLERFDLNNVLAAFQKKYKYNFNKMNQVKSDDSVKFTDVFADERAQNLWNRVKSDEDYNENELKNLNRQLIELEKNIVAYNKIQKDLKGVSENKVHEDEDHQQLERLAKQMNKEIEDTVEHITHEIVVLKENPFENEKVRNLWLKAKKTPKLIPNELDAIKSELRHLDRYFQKMSHHDQVLADHLALHPEEDESTNAFQQQQEKMAHKLKKLQTYLNEKFSEHDEL